MKKLYLQGKHGNGKCATVSDQDYDYFVQFKWYYDKDRGYVFRKNWTKRGQPPEGVPHNVYLHREVMGCPEGMVIDHADGDKLNNTRDNLRICTQAQNQQNRKKSTNKISVYKGVRNTCKQKWLADITINGKPMYLGTFLSEKDAATAYDVAAIKYFGEYALTNFKYESVADFQKASDYVESVRIRAYGKGSSRYHGVSWHKQSKRWLSSIHIDGKTRYLGCYEAELDAAMSYDIVARRIEGRHLNFPDIFELKQEIAS